MKKFTKIQENKKHFKEKNVSIKEKLENLIKSLSIEIESNKEEKILNEDFSIKADNKFYNEMNNIINKIFYQQKIELLEKAKNSILKRDISWIEDEIERIKRNEK